MFIFQWLRKKVLRWLRLVPESHRFINTNGGIDVVRAPVFETPCQLMGASLDPHDPIHTVHLTYRMGDVLHTLKLTVIQE